VLGRWSRVKRRLTPGDNEGAMADDTAAIEPPDAPAERQVLGSRLIARDAVPPRTMRAGDPHGMPSH
jgi:hypothetical protein